MIKNKNSLRADGFSVFEIVVAVAIIGILAMITIQAIGYDYRTAIKVADAKKTIRELQVQTIYYMEEHGVTPTIEDLDSLYYRNGNDTLVGKYDVLTFSDVADSDKGHGNDCDKFDEDNPGIGNGKGKGKGSENVTNLAFNDIIIYTVGKVDGEKIVYGIDDHPPQVEVASILPIVCRINPGKK